MMGSEDTPVDPMPEVVRNNDGWQWRLLITIAGFIIVVVVVLLLARLSHDLGHRPAAVNELRIQSSGQLPFNPELVQLLEELYEGKRYAVACQDGEIILRGNLWDCAEHEGFKDWVECC